MRWGRALRGPEGEGAQRAARGWDRGPWAPAPRCCSLRRYSLRPRHPRRRLPRGPWPRRPRLDLRDRSQLHLKVTRAPDWTWSRRSWRFLPLARTRRAVLAPLGFYTWSLEPQLREAATRETVGGCRASGRASGSGAPCASVFVPYSGAKLQGFSSQLAPAPDFTPLGLHVLICKMGTRQH